MVSPTIFLKNMARFIDSLPTVKVGRLGTYYNIPFSFDTETSSFLNENGEKVALLYAWMFGVSNMICMGRSVEEFVDFMEALAQLPRGHSGICVWVHNLSYDFQFIRKHFIWEKCFLTDNRKVVYAKTGRFLFRDSLIMSGGRSLALIGKDLLHHNVKKMVGDLDYNLVRTPLTPLTKKELGYCENDVRVLNAYLFEKIEQDGDLAHIPWTNTGYVRRDLKRSCFERKEDYMRIIDGLTITPDCYQSLRDAQMGGFTHAAEQRMGKVWENVYSFDIKSSYPAVMVYRYFPMSHGKLVAEDYANEHLKELLSEFCCVFTLDIDNLTPRLGYEYIISESKVNQADSEILSVINGRVRTAKHIKMVITELDYESLEEFYGWDMDTMHVSRFYIFERGRLPKQIILPIIDYFFKKTDLKGLDDMVLEYMISKNMLNAVAGCMEMNPIRNEYTYDNKEGFMRNGVPVDAPFKRNVDVIAGVEKYNDEPQRFLFFPWGVWVLAQARRNLLKMIAKVGPDYIYSDTDSIKCLNGDKHMALFEEYNEGIRKEMTDTAAYYRIPIEHLKPKDKKGRAQELGVFEFEGIYKRFKTYGAKRYLVELPRGHYSEYALTVAGLRKRTGIEFLAGLEYATDDKGERLYTKDGEALYWIQPHKKDVTSKASTLSATKDPFDFFKPNMKVPPEYSGRLAMTYIDEERRGDVVDYLGKLYNYDVLTGVHASPSEYTMGLSDDVSTMIELILGFDRAEGEL